MNNGTITTDFDSAVEAVMQASGLDFDALANCRSERCVVARVVLVDVLMELGMSEGDIAFLSGMSQQRVNSLKNSARYRLKGLAARVMREEVRKSVSLPIAEIIGENIAISHEYLYFAENNRL